MPTLAAMSLLTALSASAGAQGATLTRRSALPLETFPGVEVVYTAIRNPRGPLQRAILTRPERSTGRRPAILFVPWLSCDSVESPKGAAPGIDQFLQRLAAETPFVLLRVDKPGVGDSEGVCSKTDLEMEIEGSRAALAFLRAHPWVDGSRILIMGHSFSGAFLPLVAGDTPVAGYLVINSWIRSWFERLIEFERLRMERAGMAPSQVTERVAALIELYTGFLLEKKTPAQVIKEKPALSRVWEDQPTHQYGRPAVFFHQLQAINAARAWSGVRVPTLAIWGEADFVMHRIDHERLVALVNANAPGAARLMTVPGMDHTMRVTGSDGRPQLPESVLHEVKKFLSATLGHNQARSKPFQSGQPFRRCSQATLTGSNSRVLSSFLFHSRRFGSRLHAAPKDDGPATQWQLPLLPHQARAPGDILCKLLGTVLVISFDGLMISVAL